MASAPIPTVNSPYVELQLDVDFGRYVIKGTNIPVEVIVRMFGEGASIEDLTQSYPGISEKHVYAALIFAADVLLKLETQRQ